MKQNNLDILQLFTRKLSNCRYKISAEKLAQYLREGDFGFTFDEANNEIITNESVFADDVALVVSHIRAIFTNPHISLHKEGTIQNVSVASKIDNRSIEATYKDEKLWKIKREKMAPEFIHTYVYEDNLAIYENRFVCYLIDYLLEVVTKKISSLSAELQTFNRKIDKNTPQIAYSSDAYVAYTETKEAVPVLATEADPTIHAIRSLIKSQSILKALTTYDLYKACKKAGRFHIHSLRPTNLFMKDADYGYCYRFYTSYLDDSRIITTQSKMYFNFIAVHVFCALYDLGFTLKDGSNDILINDSADMKIRNVCFSKGLFSVCISVENDVDLVMDVTEEADQSKARYVFRMICSSTAEDTLKGKTVEQYAKELDDNRPEGVTRCFVITDLNMSSDNVIRIVPNKASSRKNIAEVLRAVTILVEGVSFIHTKYCPVCGMPHIAPQDGDSICMSCNTLYHIFTYEYRNLIWLKRLPNLIERTALIDEDDEEVEEPEETITPIEETPEESVEETVEEKVEEKVENEDDGAEDLEDAEEEDVSVAAMAGQATRRVLLKCFEGKMAQASEEQQAYYSELKNYLLHFSRINSRISWNYDSFNIGRKKAVKLAFRGQTLVAYLALNPNDYVDTKYFPHDMSDKKKFEEIPMMVKVKSERGVKFAKELIDVICKDLAEKKNFAPQEYRFPYLSDEELQEKGMLKETFVKI